MAKRKVIFLCTGNSARSQMAEGFLRHYANEHFDIHSAGLKPSQVNPLAIQVMREQGIDISGQRSKSVREYMGYVQFDDAIIVCRNAEEDCPSLHADARRIHRWLFEDPVAYAGNDDEKLNKFREIREQIDTRLRLWLDELKEDKWEWKETDTV